MHLLLFLTFFINYAFTSDDVKSNPKFDACSYASEYRDTNADLFAEKGHLVKECEKISANDQRFRGINNVKLMNDVQNILMVSVILEDQIKRVDKVELKVIQTISIVMTHNPYYFTKYFHKSLLELVNSNRCGQNETQILLRTLYKDIFREPYINFDTRHQSESERYSIMQERITNALDLDDQNNLSQLCTAVNSFINRKMSFNQGEIIGEWGGVDKHTIIRRTKNGRLFMITSYSDNAFPSRVEIEYNSRDELKYKVPYTSKRWKINMDGSLSLKHSADQESVNYPIYNTGR